ncbi:hypothetical protein [Nocardioides sp.]|jgi:hypothetical protein|uniref:hypothetical protein n=1 Tax=Nocardioides sp. TaxID=35761 RepID=UPI00260D908A|nr:hypothetical protein [Nocardioides sp.]
MDTTQLLKGVLDLAVLAVVAEEDGYGYDVVRRLRAGGLDSRGRVGLPHPSPVVRRQSADVLRRGLPERAPPEVRRHDATGTRAAQVPA